jgi:hypothetical protein
VQPGQCDVYAAPGLGTLLLQAGQLEGGPFGGVGRLHQLLRGLVDGCLHLDQTRP